MVAQPLKRNIKGFASWQEKQKIENTKIIEGRGRSSLASVQWHPLKHLANVFFFLFFHSLFWIFS